MATSTTKLLSRGSEEEIVRMVIKLREKAKAIS
jgi:hypothetical protein